MGKAAPSTKAGGIGSEAVKKATGKSWDQWLRLLDGAGCKRMDHKGIVAVVHKKAPDVSGWWGQMVTVGYEQARGLREKHQKPGGYEISGSKTVNVPVSTLFRAFSDARTRARWLDEPFTIRKSTKAKSVRITWSDEKTHVEASFYAKGASKSQVAVQHRKLTSAKDAARMKAFWAKRLAALKSTVEKSRTES
jgi:hypothetical protein